MKHSQKLQTPPGGPLGWLNYKNPSIKIHRVKYLNKTFFLPRSDHVTVDCWPSHGACVHLLLVVEQPVGSAGDWEGRLQTQRFSCRQNQLALQLELVILREHPEKKRHSRKPTQMSLIICKSGSNGIFNLLYLALSGIERYRLYNVAPVVFSTNPVQSQLHIINIRMDYLSTISLYV